MGSTVITSQLVTRREHCVGSAAAVSHGMLTSPSTRLGWLAFSLMVPVATTACTEVLVEPSVIPETHQGLTVTGEGSVDVPPDVALVQIGVEARALEPKRAVDEVNKRMELIITNLNSMGIAPADTQTSNFSVHYEPPPRPPQPAPDALPTRTAPAGGLEAAPEAASQAPPQPARGQFRVNNSLRVKVRNVERLGEVLAVAVEMGANDIGGIRFTVEEPRPIEARAREAAIADALTKAKEIARASGVTLGRVVAIDDQGGSPVIAMHEARMSMTKVAVEPGTVEVSHRVTMRFSLEPSSSSAK